jgi:hypothetical protein
VVVVLDHEIYFHVDEEVGNATRDASDSRDSRRVVFAKTGRFTFSSSVYLFVRGKPREGKPLTRT